MPRGRSKEDQIMLEMALIGYQHESDQISAKIQELKARLKGTDAAPSAPAKPAGGKRVMSAAGRKRMAAAQKKRWAEHRKRQAAAKA